MPLKRLTPEIVKFLATHMPLEIPAELAVRARKLNIKEIYFLKDANLAEYGVYGNHIVIVKGGMYFDFCISPVNSVKAILDLIS